MADTNQNPVTEAPTPAPATPAAPSASGQFLKRELSGASFLTLEHVMHMVLVVVVAALLTVGLTTIFGIWTSTGSVDAIGYMPGINPSLLAAQSAVGVAAALLLTVPLLVVLDRRTRAEWLKRKGYSGRVAYKVPVYAALGTLFAGKVMAEIAMVTVLLSSLLVIGAPHAIDVGALYMTQFMPALIAAVVFGAAAVYVFKLAKGRDAGRQFSMAAAVVSAVLVVALLATAFNALRVMPSTPAPEDYFKDYDSSKLEDLFNY